MTSSELLQLAHTLAERGDRYAMVTVVRVAAPTSAYVGAQAIVVADGTLHGWIGGGCARDVVIAAAKGAIESGEPGLVRIANDTSGPEEGIAQHAMACASNGTIELFIQPYGAMSSLCILGDTPAADDARFFANRLGIRVCDTLERAPVVLIATQGQDDADALERALRSCAQHVLMVASRRKAEKLRELMCARGIDESRLARLQAPAGPDAGARTPSEIALVAMTGVLALLRGRVASQPTVHVAPAVAAATVETFVNPVCGIPVSTVNPRHVEIHDGVAFYFCCDGCWTTFRQNPAKYAEIHRASQGRVTA